MRRHCNSQKMWLPLLLLFSISMIFAIKDGKPISDHSGGQSKDDDLSATNIHFAISLYKLVSSKTARAPLNVFISPISTYTTLAMMGLGARSSTRQQILEAMGLNSSQTNKVLREDFKNYLKKLRTETGDIEFIVTNWLFQDRSITILPQYKQDLAQYFNASIQTIDFTDSQNAEQKINQQVNSQTDGRIEDLVSNLDTQTKMVLLDYASFTAKWDNPFNSQETQSAHFKVNDNKTVEVEMMHRVGQYKTFKDSDLELVEIPYNRQLVLLLLVPKMGNLNKLEQKLSVELIQCYRSKAKTSLLDLYIPQISIEQQNNVQYGLLHMGITQVFSDTADLSRISDEPELKVSKIYQKIVLKMREVGTGSTGSDIAHIITLPKAFELHIDRPFLALVYNKLMNSALFLGRVLDPSQF